MYIICYDVCDTRTRNKVFKELKNYGCHTQYSVFECNISGKQLKVLEKQLKKLMAEDEGNIQIYTVCDRCYSQKRMIGEAGKDENDIEELAIIL